jgi:hypothetical protein
MKATSTTHQQYAVPPTRFRAQATGCGNARSTSEATGAARAAEVVQAMPDAQRKALAPSQGYPTPGAARD